MKITLPKSNIARKGFQWKSFFHLIKKMDSFDFLNESLIALALS